MKRNKATIYDVYKYMNDEQFSILKYTGTTLLQSFTHINTEFEVRLTKDNRTVLFCIDGIIYDRTNLCGWVQNKMDANKLWYLELNWDDAAEQIAGEMQDKKRFLSEQLTK